MTLDGSKYVLGVEITRLSSCSPEFLIIFFYHTSLRFHIFKLNLKQKQVVEIVYSVEKFLIRIPQIMSTIYRK